MIEKLTLIMHVLTAAALIGLILIQQGKGADMGASFGSGSSQTLFGSSGSAGFLARFTAILACVFFVTSFSLAIIAKHRVTAAESDLPVIENTLIVEEAPAASDVPVMTVVEESVSEVPAAPSAGDAVTAPADVPGDVPAQ
ncbi:MAG TPA: preprotein translocase subunit SecG [Pseudomonadales bacterium]|jgi:preprotein translocase subunit SecG